MVKSSKTYYLGYCDVKVSVALHLSIYKQVQLTIVRYFLFTYITTTTIPSFPDIQAQFNINYSQVNWTVAIPALGLAVGPLFWSSFSDIYGRRIVFIVGTVISLVSTCGAAAAMKYGGYMAARFFQGFGVSPASTVGMAVGVFPPLIDVGKN